MNWTHLPMGFHLSTGSRSQKSYHLVQSTGSPLHRLKKKRHDVIMVRTHSQTDLLCWLLTSLTVNECLLFWVGNADQVSSKVSTVLFSLFPHCSLREVQVTVTLKLSPALLTCFCVCSDIWREWGSCFISVSCKPGTNWVGHKYLDNVSTEKTKDY